MFDDKFYTIPTYCRSSFFPSLSLSLSVYELIELINMELVNRKKERERKLHDYDDDEISTTKSRYNIPKIPKIDLVVE